MKFKDTRVNQGGLMRCCLQSLGESYEDDDEVQDGDHVACKYGKMHTRMILDGDTWRWWSECNEISPPSRAAYRMPPAELLIPDE